MRYRKLMCPVDFSACSRAALDAAIDLAGAEGTLTLVHLYQAPALVDPVLPASSDWYAAIARDAEENTARWCDQARAKLGAGRVESICREGVPWFGIVELARDKGTELIVIGTHGRTGLKHVFLGSVAEKVVRHAPCPVLVVRPTEPTKE